MSRPDTKARVLVADPGWTMRDKLPGKKRGAAKHYKLMSLTDIFEYRRQLPALLDDSYLFLWRLASMQQEALHVMKAWGFTLKTEIVWKKLTNKGNRHFGMGNYFRGEHEVCLLGVRGKPKDHSHRLRSMFDGVVRKHSQKPEEFYKLVEDFASGPYTELFARSQRIGWQCYGNELSLGMSLPRKL